MSLLFIALFVWMAVSFKRSRALFYRVCATVVLLYVVLMTGYFGFDGDEDRLVAWENEEYENCLLDIYNGDEFSITPWGFLGAQARMLDAGFENIVRFVLDGGRLDKNVITKPILYLYPEEQTDTTVSIKDAGHIVSSYPAYGDGWQVSAAPDGTLTDKNGREYNYLFWEDDGIGFDADFSEGFCIKGSDTAAFLEEQLAYMRLTDKEACDFISFWLPQMEGNPYNVISFQFDNYEAYEGLQISPEPDSIQKVIMAWKPSDKFVTIKEQIAPGFERYGFTAVEWGGVKYE